MIRTILLALLIQTCVLAQAPQHIEKLSVKLSNDSSFRNYVKDNRIFLQGWNNLPQVAFWKDVVRLSPDSGLLNVGSSRLILARLSAKQWASLSDLQKDTLRAAIRTRLSLSSDESIFFTRGKGDFYDFDNALTTIGSAYKTFEEEGVPPFYAQSILLIECPGKLQRSSAGAHGHFQLMPGVARSMGLKITKYVDERKDFEKCTRAAAKFIKTVCIPNANKVLTERNIAYSEEDLWYRMLVLHVYHAGAGNVAKAIDAFAELPTVGSMDLITTLWKTRAGAFGNASQNYSQIALANTLVLYEMLQMKCIEMLSAGNSVGTL